MKNKYYAFLFCKLFILQTIAQPVKTPDVPDGIDWMEDDERMKKGKIKEISEYEYQGGEKIKTGEYKFDVDGFLTEAKNFRNGVEHRSYTCEYSIGHNAHLSYIIKYHGEISVYMKSKCDIYGFEVETSRQKPDGTFAWEEKFKHYYNANKQIDSSFSVTDYGHKQKWIFKYDNKARIINVSCKADSNPEWNWKYSYDSVGHLINEYWWEIDEETKDSSMVANSDWLWDKEGKLLQQSGKGRGWKNISYVYSGDSLAIDMKRGAEFGPGEKYLLYNSPENGTVIRIKALDESGKLEDEKWFEYLYY